MNILRISATVGLALAALVGGAANAAITMVERPVNTPEPGDANYVSVNAPTSGAGVYGVELRLGNASTWEAGVGSRTSQSGYFAQNNVAWGPGSNPSALPYTLTWTTSGLSFTIDGRTTVFAAPVGGNTLRISAKRDATITVDNIDGTTMSQSVAGTRTTGVGNDLFFYSSDAFGGNGFTVTGTARVGTGGGAGLSSSGATFTLGDYTPAVGGVPEPGTWAMMIAGFSLVGASARRRRIARAAA